MKNIKVPDDHCWESCAYARDLTRLHVNPDKYISTERDEFHLCANCVARLDGVQKEGWLFEKVIQDNAHRRYQAQDLKMARDYAEKNVRVSGWRGGMNG